MSSRGPNLDDLIRAQREGVGLSEVQRASNRARLLSRVMVGGAVSVSGAAVSSTAVATSWAGRVAVGMLLAGGVGVVYVAARPASPIPLQAQAPRRPPAAGAPAVSVIASPVPAEPAQPEPSTSGPAASLSPLSNRLRQAHSSSSPSLAAEVQLMHDVEAALRGGQPQQALTLLDQHGGGGLLTEERAAAHIVTLCQLGRVDAARNEATRFLRNRPRSPLAARVRATCAKPVESAVPEKQR